MKTLLPSLLTRNCHAERGSSFANAKLDRSRSIPTLPRTARGNGVLSVPCVMASARLFPFLVLLLFSAAAQTPSTKRPPQATAYKLIEVKVTGSKRFTSQEVAASSGLPVGTIAHEEGGAFACGTAAWECAQSVGKRCYARLESAAAGCEWIGCRGGCAVPQAVAAGLPGERGARWEPALKLSLRGEAP
jgi:hypothetical protein